MRDEKEYMSTLLSISNKLLALKGRMCINDDSGTLLYDATAEATDFRPNGRTLKDSNEVATVRQKVVSWFSTEFVASTPGSSGFIIPTWRITKDSSEVATIRRKIFSWSPRWLVTSTLGNFTIQRKIWSRAPRYNILSGPYDGAIVRGNIWGLTFQISYVDKTIASAKGKILTLRDTHTIEVFEDGQAPELFTAIIMFALHLDSPRIFL
jgi:uncharacterized protein YxjI